MRTLVNFRDLAGYVTSDGGVVIKKKLLRSGEIVNLCEEDIKVLLKEYELQLIIDFRGKQETQEKPDIPLPNVAYTNIDIMKAMHNGATSLKNFEHEMLAFSPEETMKSTYRKMVLDESAQSGYRAFFQHVLHHETGSLLFHCFAGKDRTGIAAALLLKGLGVSDEDVFDDYLKTNMARKSANENIILQAKQAGIADDKLSNLRCFLEVKKEYLMEAFQAIDEEYGNLMHYFKTVLNLQEPEMQMLRKKYIKM